MLPLTSLIEGTLNGANSRSDRSSLITRQQQNQRTNRENGESGNKWTDYEYSCQSAKIIRGGRASMIDAKYHSKKVTRRRANEHNRRIHKGRHPVPRSSKTMLPIKKYCADERENGRQKGKRPEY